MFFFGGVLEGEKAISPLERVDRQTRATYPPLPSRGSPDARLR